MTPEKRSRNDHISSWVLKYRRWAGVWETIWFVKDFRSGWIKSSPPKGSSERRWCSLLFFCQLILPADLVSLGMIQRMKWGAVLRRVVIKLFSCSYVFVLFVSMTFFFRVFRSLRIPERAGWEWGKEKWAKEKKRKRQLVHVAWNGSITDKRSFDGCFGDRGGVFRAESFERSMRKNYFWQVFAETFFWRRSFIRGYIPSFITKQPASRKNNNKQLTALERNGDFWLQQVMTK